MPKKRQLVIKPYQQGDEPKPRTQAQRKAHHRTWRIVQLRSLWVLACHIHTPWRLRLVRWLIDGELRSMKAEPHGVRAKRQRAEFEHELKARFDNRIPF